MIIPNFIKDLGLESRFKWYQEVSEKGRLSTSWECYIADISGKIASTKDTDLHRLVYATELSHVEMRHLSTEAKQLLCSLKPGPLQGFDPLILGIVPIRPLESSSSIVKKDFVPVTNSSSTKRKPETVFSPDSKRQKL